MEKAHRTLFKVVANTILRWLQCWKTDRPYLIASKFDKNNRLVGFGFRRIQCFKHKAPLRRLQCYPKKKSKRFPL